MKAATYLILYSSFFAKISIHAAREGGDLCVRFRYPLVRISIHAAREGGDIAELWFIPSTSRFQSTPPVKAATIMRTIFTQDRQISIHAAREGGDLLSCQAFL